jgi:hypothetical protein
MALVWKDASPASTPPRSTSAGADPWFGVSMILIGIILGYVVGSLV